MTSLSKRIAAEKVEELTEIRMQMQELLFQAREILRGTGMIKKRAEAYWLNHLDHVLTEDGRSDTTLSDTIAELNDVVDRADD